MRRLQLPKDAYATPRVSPDGRRVAYSVRGTNANIWIANLDGETVPRRLTFDGRNRFPVWSADGEHVAFESDRAGAQAIFWQRADGNGNAEQLTTPEAGTAHAPEAFSPDGDRLLVRVTSGTTFSLWSWSRRDQSLVRLDEAGSRETNATFSPDGRWIAYNATEGSRARSFVQPFPPNGAKYQLPVPEESSDMAIHPVWVRGVPELIYAVGQGMLASTRVNTSSTVDFGPPTVVRIPGAGDASFRSWDVTPDGRSIVRVIEADAGPALSPPIHVVLNWFEELKARTPVR